MDRLAEALQGFDGAEDDGAGGGGGGGGGAVWCGVDYVRIDGSHDSAERRDAVARFRCVAGRPSSSSAVRSLSLLRSLHSWRA